MENLPDDILSNIFIRLRAKQLAQMRCISKPWNALLSQPSFVKIHLDRSVHNNDGILFVFTDSELSKPLTVYPSRSPHIEPTNFTKLPYNNQYSYKVIGSVNGLICFEHRPYDYFKVICIWNPSLSALVTLPPDYVTNDVLRFGFDPQSDDYKVVKFTEGINNRYKKCLQIEVYSMRKGSWKLLTQKILSHLKWIYDNDHMCLDGHHPNLHWLVKTEFGGNSILVIIAFDLGAETFSEIHLPDSIRDGFSISSYLGVLGGKLCLMSSVEFGECEVWVMEEYGVAGSWVKLHVFPWFGHGFKPYGFTLHNEFIFAAKSHGLALYDPLEDKIKSFKFSAVHYHWGCKVVEYVDSLVWVTPPKQSNSQTSLLRWFLHALLGWFLALFNKKERKTVKVN